VSNAKQEEFPLKAGNRCKLQDKKKQRITKKKAEVQLNKMLKMVK